MSKILPSQLRHGVYVMYEGMRLMVLSVEYPKPRREERYNHKWILELSADGIIVCTLDEIEPIKLTMECLPKLGFTSSVNPNLYRFDDNFAIYNHDGDLIFRGLGMSVVEVQYVHHLQNIILDLTEKEIDFTNYFKQ